MPEEIIVNAITAMLDNEPELDCLCKQVYTARNPLHEKDMLNTPSNAHYLLMWKCPGIRLHRSPETDAQFSFCPNKSSNPTVYNALSERYNKQ